MERKVKLITTEDGSHSLFVPELNETYHSFHGAFRESYHVFILYGLEVWHAKNRTTVPIRVFEMGFGTGLNAWMAQIWAEQNLIPMLYHTVEPFPIEKEIYEQLNYAEIDEGFSHYGHFLEMLHAAPWGIGEPLTPYFNMKKEKITLEEVQLYPSDVIFYDAFAPNKQPELWTKEMLEKVVESMKAGAVFVTYCAKGQVKRDLADLGLHVETIPGPPGKKEMTRAWKF
ncbi:tRNA (5-methylaminomethyl-2-thiouridine)(34)-methyltransferase MnmD [Pararhodonellum marinum]|uniref:tRNA (5-methylaminomethyl-2-thiouridine)(34)-methyltransferase MnmD n=1 Tax=Pararhodonellum marinum TaxID=2755358 RepID=UPI00188FA9A8|nr:tRNA (5-methylaminomethyl-2-thiouridine)(34)-methyltransferase MnmD [Pararhodonellum marinum]